MLAGSVIASSSPAYGAHSPVRARASAPLPGAEGQHVHLDVEHRAVVEGLRPHLRLPRAEDGHEHLREAVREDRRAVRGALLGEVDGDVPQLVLPPPVRAVAAVVENFDPGALRGESVRLVRICGGARRTMGWIFGARAGQH